MTIKQQLGKLMDNWLLILMVLVIIIAMGVVSPIASSFSKSMNGVGYQSYSAAFDGERSMGGSTGYYPTSDDSFAPGVTERKITKTANLATEVHKGEFNGANEKVKNIVSMSNSYLLNENVYKNSYDDGRREYYTGQYTIKVDTKKYMQVLTELKAIGTVKTFSENAEDITGTYMDLENEIAAEKAKLDRYNNLYATTQSTQEKIDLVDRIFNQERTIKYLEDALLNQDARIDYSTVYVTITEKQSDYANIAIVKFSSLARSLVGSFNSLLYLIFLVLPYAAAGGIVWFIIWLIRTVTGKKA
jgi:hypothetical protein